MPNQQDHPTRPGPTHPLVPVGTVGNFNLDYQKLLQFKFVSKEYNHETTCKESVPSTRRNPWSSGIAESEFVTGLGERESSGCLWAVRILQHQISEERNY